MLILVVLCSAVGSNGPVAGRKIVKEIEKCEDVDDIEEEFHSIPYSIWRSLRSRLAINNEVAMG